MVHKLRIPNLMGYRADRHVLCESAKNGFQCAEVFPPSILLIGADDESLAGLVLCVRFVYLRHC